MSNYNNGKLIELENEITRLRAEADKLHAELVAAEGFGKTIEAQRNALRAELDALRKQEPVAFLQTCGTARVLVDVSRALDADGLALGWTETPLYAAPVAPSVQEGWQLVPKEPTPEMIATQFGGCDFQEGLDWLTESAMKTYREMLAAAPRPGEGK